MSDDALDRGQGVVKRSVTIAGHRTSLSLEAAFWAEVKAIARAEGVSINRLITRVDAVRAGNLSSAVRVYVLDRVRRRVETDADH